MGRKHASLKQASLVSSARFTKRSLGPKTELGFSQGAGFGGQGAGGISRHRGARSAGERNGAKGFAQCQSFAQTLRL